MLYLEHWDVYIRDYTLRVRMSYRRYPSVSVRVSRHHIIYREFLFIFVRMSVTIVLMFTSLFLVDVYLWTCPPIHRCVLGKNRLPISYVSFLFSLCTIVWVIAWEIDWILTHKPIEHLVELTFFLKFLFSNRLI